MIRRFLAGLVSLVFSCCYSNALAQDTTDFTQVMNGTDDGTAHIQLQHTFPYYGGVFTDAWMSSNGFIMFYDPVSQFGNPNNWNDGCCDGFNPAGRPQFSYMIAPLWTDLRHNTGIPDSGYFYQANEDNTRFLWKNITEYGTNNLNTFGVELFPDGSFNFNYADVNITNHSTWIGFTGDTTYQNPQGIYEEVNEIFYKTRQEGGMTMDHVANFAGMVNETDEGTLASWSSNGSYDSNQITGPDCSDPLNDSTCPGYEQAYFDQQCSTDPFYDTQCPGYAQAYYDQQCSTDPFYDTQCPGYAQAYYDQQCGYDPLYDTLCPGYEQAYFDQQCSLDPLYNEQCPGYAAAYQALLEELARIRFLEECSEDPLQDINCPGYEQALAVQMAQSVTETFTAPIIENTPIEEEDYGYTETTGFGDTDDFGYDQTEEYGEGPIYGGDGDEEVYTESIVYENEQSISEGQDAEEQFVEELVLNEDAPTDIFEEELVAVVEEVETVATTEEAAEESATEETEEDNEVTEEEKETNEKLNPSVLAIVLNVVAETSNTNSTSEKTEQKLEVSDVFSSENTMESEENSSEIASEENTSVDYASNKDGPLETVESVVAETATPSQEGETMQETVENLTFSQQTMQFEQNFTEAAATGQSLGQFLSGQQPDFGKFDVAPPPAQEQQQLNRAENTLATMSQEDIEQALEDKQGENSEDGGFNTDQRVTLMLMNHVDGYSSYMNVTLPDKPQWYQVKDIYDKNRINDDNRRNINMLRESTGKHKELVDLQYD